MSCSTSFAVCGFCPLKSAKLKKAVLDPTVMSNLNTGGSLVFPRTEEWWCRPAPLERPPRPKRNVRCPPAEWSSDVYGVAREKPCKIFSIPDHEEMSELNRWYMAYHLERNVKTWRNPKEPRYGRDGVVSACFLYFDVEFHSGVERAYGSAPNAVAVGKPWPYHQTRACGITLARNGLRKTPQHETFQWTTEWHVENVNVVIGERVGPAPVNTAAKERAVPTGYSWQGNVDQLAVCCEEFGAYLFEDDLWFDVDGNEYTRDEVVALVGSMSNRRQYERAIDQGFRYWLRLVYVCVCVLKRSETRMLLSPHSPPPSPTNKHAKRQLCDQMSLSSSSSS